MFYINLEDVKWALRSTHHTLKWYAFGDAFGNTGARQLRRHNAN